MRTLHGLLGGWLLVLAAPWAAAQPLPIERMVPTANVLSRYGMEVAWSGQAVLNPGRDGVEQISLDEEVVFINGTNSVITAFDAETGQRLWAQKLGSFDGPSYPVVTNEDLALVVVETSMFGVEKFTGDILWEIRLPSPASTGPAIDDTQLYVGTLDGSVYAFSLKKIRQMYLERRLPAWSFETVVWRFQATKEITSPPLPIEGAVNFASRDGTVYSVGRTRKKLNYQFETNAPILAPITSSGSLQFFGSEDLTFYGVNAANGAIRWEFVVGLPIRTAPVALGSSLFLNPERGGLYRLDAETGSRLWWQPRLTTFVSLVSSTVVARDMDENLALVDYDSGRLMGRIPAAYYNLHAVNNRNDRVYLANHRGQILALREAGRTYPIFHRYPERRPILPEFAPEGDAEGMPMEEKPAENPAETN